MKSLQLRATLALLFALSALPLQAGDINISLVSRQNPTDPLEINVEPLRPVETFYSLGDVLNQNTTVVVKDSGDGRVQNAFINGTADGVVVIIDGVRAPQDASGRTDLSNIDVNAIASIRVLEGPRFEYGPSASAGVILITTKQPESGVHKGTATIGIGSLRTQDAALALAGGITDKLNYTLNTSYAASDGFQQNAEWDKKAVNASLFYKLTDDSKIGINAGYTAGRWNLPGGTDVPYNEWNGGKERPALTPHDWFTQDLLTLSAVYNSPEFEIVAGYSGLDYKSYLEDNIMWGVPPEGRDRYHSFNGGVKYLGIENLTVGADFTSSYAAELSFTDDGRAFRHQNTFGGYASYIYSLGPVSFNPSARYDYDNIYRGVLTGGLLTKINLAEKSFLFVNIARGSRTPVIQDRPYASDNLNREYSNNYEAGAQIYALNTALGASAFIIDYKDKIVWVPTGPFTGEIMNEGDSRTRGVKAFANTAIGLFENNFNIALTKALDEHKIRKTHSPVTVVTNQTAVKLGSFVVFHSLEYTKMSATNSGVDKWQWLDLGAGIEYKIDGRASLIGGVSNYLDERYSRNLTDYGYGFVGYPNPGRTFTLSLKYNFWS